MKYLLLLFLFTGCNDFVPEKSFSFFDRVKIINGFFKGCTGVIIDKPIGKEYHVELTCITHEYIITRKDWVNPENMELQ